MLEGQIKNARKVYELRKYIPDDLRPFLDFRPKKTGITLVSFFEFAPMRGVNVSHKAAQEEMAKIGKMKESLLAPTVDDEAKIKKLTDLGFKSRKKDADDYLEEDVQAFLCRELLKPAEGDIPRHIREDLLGLKGRLKYLTAEFEWSLDGEKDRVDILCRDEKDPARLVVIELKKIRTEKLEQSRYVPILKTHEKELADFAAALTGVKELQPGNLRISMIYLMPNHHRLDIAQWRNVATKCGIDGIVFYEHAFSFGRIAERDC